MMGDIERRIEILSDFITDNKKEKVSKIINNRTNYLTLVLEDIFQPQNASATLRTSEILGITDIHIIENNNKYTLNKDIVLGASKWINLYKYQNGLKSVIPKLKDEGYLIVATGLTDASVSLEDIKIDKKMAVFFGTELTGLSNDVIENSDIQLKIPMYGFTQSYNLSVSVGIVFYTLLQRLIKSNINYLLNPDEKLKLKLEYYRKIVKNFELIENIKL